MISVIIPHLDQAEDLIRCLKSLNAQRHQSASVEIIVVDNGSKVLPADICRDYGASLHVQLERGPGPARNLGVSNARGDILAFIDADCIAGAGWLETIGETFRTDAAVEIIGGDVRIACENPARLTLLEAYESVFAYRMKEYIEQQGFTGTGNLAVRAKTFAKVGEFGGIDIAEDRDWGQRALAMGIRTHYQPRMIAYHPARKSLREIAGKWERHIYHDFARARGRPAWRVRWLLRSAAIAASPVAEVIRIGLSDRLTGLHSRLLALAGVIVIRLYRAKVMFQMGLGTRAPQLEERWRGV